MTEPCPKCGGQRACNLVMGDVHNSASGTFCPKCDVKYDFNGTLDEARVVIAELWRQVATYRGVRAFTAGAAEFDDIQMGDPKTVMSFEQCVEAYMPDSPLARMLKERRDLKAQVEGLEERRKSLIRGSNDWYAKMIEAHEIIAAACCILRDERWPGADYSDALLIQLVRNAKAQKEARVADELARLKDSLGALESLIREEKTS